MELTVLGCGDAFGSAGRNNTAFLLSEGNDRILLDCGASTLIRLKQESVDLEEISTILISHFHGDHYGGLPFFLISSMFEFPRSNPLHIIGPKGVHRRVRQLQEAMYPGTAEKIASLNISFHEFRSQNQISLGDLTVRAWNVEHSPPSNPHAYQLTWRGKKIAFSGDTSWNDHLIPLAENTDLFICECNFLNQASFGHLSYQEIWQHMELFRTRQLWLTHMSDEVISSSEIQVNRMYDGLKIMI